MGHRAFVVQFKNQQEVDAIHTWLKGDSCHDAEYFPFHWGMVVYKNRQYALLECDGSWGVNAIYDAGFRDFRRLRYLEEPYASGFYKKMRRDGKHYDEIELRKIEENE